jgi:hypothetical protein
LPIASAAFCNVKNCLLKSVVKMPFQNFNIQEWQSKFSCKNSGVHSKFLLLWAQQKQYTQTVKGQNFEDGVYIIVAPKND